MNLSAPFIARPIATSLLAVAVLLAGLLGYQALPVSSLPEVSFPTIQVSTQLPGASPDTMARLVTAPLERQFGQIPGLDAMSSQSTAGLSGITLRFSLARNIDSAAADVQAAISAAAGTLPPNLPYPPVFAKVNPADAPILTLALTSRRMPLYRVADAADTLLAEKLSQITGVGQVSVAGGLKRALRVRIDPARLAGYGLSMEDVRLALAAANQNGAKGGFDGAKQAIALGANDQISTPAGYRNLVIAWRNGAPVHLSDVGTVIVGLVNDRVDASWQGKPAVVVDIRRQPGANIVATVDTILARLPAIERALPAGIAVKVVADRTSTIRASVRDVQATLLLSVALVVGVIFLFLRTWRATLVPALALPLSLIGTFGVMALIGYGLDNLSLMALTVAAGFVVDDAIVMIENVVRHIELGETPLAAAYRGAKQIGFTIVSLTVSLIAVFIPLLFMTGVVGRLFHAFAITLSIAVVVSAVVSLTLSPMLCGRLLRPAAREHPGALSRALERGFEGLLGLYRRSLAWTLAREGLFLFIAALTLVGTVWLYIAVPKGFLPTQDTGEILAITQGAQDISIPALKTLQARAVRAAMADPAVAGVVSLVGSGVANPTPDTGRLVIVLKPIGARPPIGPVMASLARRFAPITGLTVFQQPVQDITIGSRVSRTQYQYTLVDSSAPELARWAPRLLARLRALRQLRNVASDAQNRGLAVAVAVDRASAMRLGVSMQSVENVLYDAFGQRQISTIFAQSNQYRLVLEAGGRWQANPALLGQLSVPGTGGVQVPLSAIARFSTRAAPISVTRENQLAAVTLSFDLAPGVSLGEAVQAIGAARSALGMPAAIDGAYSGQAAEFQRALAAEPWLILAAVVVIYIVLGVLYESVLHPLTILSTLPSAGIGALLALMFTGHDLSVVALIGIVLLMGIVKKNAIMMIDFAIEAERGRGLSPLAAIEEAAALRFRPIMMTTMAALLGAVPLLVMQGAGAELRVPLGITIVGGLLLSQVLTLYTTPVIYLALERLRARFARAPLALAEPAE